MIRIEAITGEVAELAHHTNAAGLQFIRVKVMAPGDQDRRMNVWLPRRDAAGLSLGTQVRVTVEVLP